MTAVVTRRRLTSRPDDIWWWIRADQREEFIEWLAKQGVPDAVGVTAVEAIRIRLRRYIRVTTVDMKQIVDDEPLEIFTDYRVRSARPKWWRV